MLHPVEPPVDDGGRTDRELLAAHAAGDVHAFAHLVRRHERRLWAVAMRTMRDPDDAADAVQDALISAYRGAAAFRGDAAVSTWLPRIVVNACLDRLRRSRPTAQLPDDDVMDMRGVGVNHDAISRVDDRLSLQAALDALPQAQRLAVLLVDVEGFSVMDAGRLLGVAGGTVKSRCSRGRAALAAWLRAVESTDPEPGSASEPSNRSGRRTGGTPSNSEQTVARSPRIPDGGP